MASSIWLKTPWGEPSPSKRFIHCGNETHKLDGLRKYMANLTGNKGMLRLFICNG